MALQPVELINQRILITGATGFVANPIIESLSANNKVFAAARFKDESAKQKIEALGAEALVLDLGDDQLVGLPADIDYVINLAVAKSGKWSIDMKVNAEGVGKLLIAYPKAKAFLHFSSTAVYEYAGHEPRSEKSPLGDNHRSLFETYSISKISAETVASFVAKQQRTPLTIARLNVPYGSFPCWPFFHAKMMEAKMPIDVHPEGPNGYSPIHGDDIVRAVPYLLAAATPDVEVVNLGGSVVVGIEEWCEYISELTGLSPIYNSTNNALGNLTVDVSKLESIAGPSTVDWKQGVRVMLEDLAPELLLSR
ncbi:GDP-L-fucose synthase [BD1-7 clade bacterium]|uniref:GDP-L-fucose synthase n=1 Tax=BD1-7 clade bacterium TaxID=2029982 RepID=A0A5S9PUI9_9GAMM|nr:GDP-L-fucose synthase [BD1-7 clade bacterium]CAA0107954.1 GDP-L-fucose synthase [BD1-7 clade bacterium]